MFARTDVTKAADADAMVAAAVDRWGRLDCAHNNAGISLQAPSFVTGENMLVDGGAVSR